MNKNVVNKISKAVRQVAEHLFYECMNTLHDNIVIDSMSMLFSLIIYRYLFFCVLRCIYY